MGFLVNKTTKKIHEENCIFACANYQKTKNKRDCKFKYFKTKKPLKIILYNKISSMSFANFVINKNEENKKI